MPIDPHVLLARRNFSQEPKSCDGRVGAIVLHGEFFVASPNMDYVYTPPVMKEMTFKTDLRLGDDDPLQWPQFFIKECAHYPCIPRPCDGLSKNATDHIMFHRVKAIDFEEAALFRIAGLGFLRDHLIVKLRIFITKIIDPKYQEIKAKGFRYEIFPILHNSIHRSLMHLESFPLTRRQVLFVFADLQRDLLEFTAAYTYVTKVMALMKGEGEPASKVAQVIGAFVTDVSMADSFVRAGVPVWVVHPASLAGVIRVDKIDTPIQPELNFSLESAKHIYPFSCKLTLYSDAKKYNVLGRYRREFLSYGHDIFDTASLPQEDLLVKTARKARFQPYKIPTNPYSGGRNKFIDIDHALLPPMHPVWSSSLLVVNQNRVFSTQLGYAFPEPGLFVAVGQEERRALFFYNWLKYRPILIQRMMTAPCSIRPQVWRTLLNMPWDADVFNTSSPSGPSTAPQTKCAKERKMVTDMLGELLSRDRDISLHTGILETPEWFGVKVSPHQAPSESVARQILWELSELNFRYELYVLDGHQNYKGGNHSPLARDVLISRCFYGNSMLLVSLDHSKEGLSSRDWKIRLPYIRAFHDVLLTWPGWNFEQKVDRSSEASVLALETATTRFYSQKFYDTFGRAPTVPRCI